MSWTKDNRNNDEPPITHDALLKELCEVIERREMAPTRLEFYRRAVESFPIAALKDVLSELYSQSPMPSKLPSPSELGGLTRRQTPRLSSRSGSTDDERWRRRYDVWQRGQFSPEALEVAFTLDDAELGVGEEGDVQEVYLSCQQPGCSSLIPWPAANGRAFCPQHDERGEPAVVTDKLRLLNDTTPRAKAFLRTALEKLMAMIPVTAEEDQAAAEQQILTRPKAFEQTAEGPGVNPSLFLHNPFLTEGLATDYAERRQMVAAAGWKFSPEKGHWTKHKRVLTDEQVDSFSDKGILHEFLIRR